MTSSFRIGSWVVHPRLGVVSRSTDKASSSAEDIHLEPRAMQVLVYFAERAGEVITKDEVFREIWEEAFVTDEALTNCISSLRKALDDDAKKPKYIQTIPKQGYRLIATVSLDRVELPVGVKPQTDFHPAKDSEPSKRKRLVKLLAALTVVAVASVIGIYLLKRSHEGDDTRLVPMKGTFTQLTRESGWEFFPTLSPDGKFVVYTGRAAGNWDVYLLRVGGERAMNLTQDCPADDTQPVFSPDGERIAFRSDRDGGGIFLMGATGESVRRLTDFGYNPAWSPDGREIVCATEGIEDAPDSRFTISQLWVVDTITGVERHLVTEKDAVQPHWSPKGHRIAFWGANGQTKQRDIWTLPAGGGEAASVTNDEAVDWNPVWSPDGLERIGPPTEDTWPVDGSVPTARSPASSYIPWRPSSIAD